MEAQEIEEVDLSKLQEAIEATMDEPEEISEVEEEVTENEEIQEVEEEINLDEILNSDQPYALEGVITEEQAEAEASKRGWRPDGEDRFGHKISAIEFLERAPMFKKISLLKGDIDDLKKQQQQIIEQNKKIAQKSVEDKKLLNEQLKAAKQKLLEAEYLDADDVAKLKALDTQIDNTTVVEPEQDEDQLTQDYATAKERFEGENDWYKTDYAMTMKADEIGVKYAQDYYDKHGVVPPPEDTFKYMSDEIKKAFPEEKPKRQTRVASTQTRTVATKPKKGKTIEDIPEDQRAVAKEVMEAAELSVEEYLKTYQF